LTTFITEWGRFKFLRGTMGLNATGDEYCRRTQEALGGLDNTVIVVDDILRSDETWQQHVTGVQKLLSKCREHQITLNPDKFRFGAQEVKWAGYIISTNGVAADPAKLEAITKFPAPTNITEMRRFMGMIEQLVDFTPDMSVAVLPLRPLLSPSNLFLWNADHEFAFERVKEVLASPPVLRQFDIHLETAVHTDASKLNGLGFA